MGTRAWLEGWLAVGVCICGSACGPAGSRVVEIKASPTSLDPISRVSTLLITATDASGSIGKGSITLSTSAGELDQSAFVLDDFGTARTVFSCPASDASCGADQRIDVRATWLDQTQHQTVASTRLGIALPVGAGGGSWTPASCTAEAKLIYLLTPTSELYSFDPPSKELLKVGTLACPTTATANSMAIGQDGIGWANFSNGSLFRINIRTAGCTATTFVPPPGWTRFGMGFSPDGPSSPTETLFIATAGGGLAKVDLLKMKATAVGPFTGSGGGQAVELTGTTSGRLFGFFLGTTPGATGVAEIDKATAKVGTPRTIASIAGATGSYAFAFSSWLDEFYLYFATTGPSTVTRYRPADDTVVEYMPAASVGIAILGAGVSRCGGAQ